MGKTKRKKQCRNHCKTQTESTIKSKKSEHLPLYQRCTNLPLPFPQSQSVPKNTFLRNEKPYLSAFQTALDTSYEGFVQDIRLDSCSKHEKNILFDHEAVQKAFSMMDSKGFFRTDVTQVRSHVLRGLVQFRT